MGDFWDDIKKKNEERRIAGIKSDIRVLEEQIKEYEDAKKKVETLQIILLKMWGFKVKEIAIKMGIPEKTIYTRMNRLKKKIKKILKG